MFAVVWRRVLMTRWIPLRTFTSFLPRRQRLELLGSVKPLEPSVRTYKIKQFPKLRCEGCYFIRLNGRLHVECKLKPRHKQKEPMDVKLLW